MRRYHANFGDVRRSITYGLRRLVEQGDMRQATARRPTLAVVASLSASMSRGVRLMNQVYPPIYGQLGWQNCQGKNEVRYYLAAGEARDTYRLLGF